METKFQGKIFRNPGPIFGAVLMVALVGLLAERVEGADPKPPAKPKKRAESVVRYDIGDGKLPEWIPKYPGSDPKPRPTYYNHPIERNGLFSFAVKAKPEEVYEFYRKALVAKGFKIPDEDEIPVSTALGNTLGQFTAVQGSRKVSIAVVREKPGASTDVFISYEEQLISDD